MGSKTSNVSTYSSHNFSGVLFLRYLSHRGINFEAVDVKICPLESWVDSTMPCVCVAQELGLQ